MFHAYILKSLKTGRYYIGSTEDLKKRIERHNSGGNKSTKHGAPWHLVHSEEFATEQDAYRREFQIKSYKAGSAFKKLVGK